MLVSLNLIQLCKNKKNRLEEELFPAPWLILFNIAVSQTSGYNKQNLRDLKKKSFSFG